MVSLYEALYEPLSRQHAAAVASQPEPCKGTAPAEAKAPFQTQSDPDGKSLFQKEKYLGLSVEAYFGCPQPGCRGLRPAHFFERVLGPSKLGWMP